MKFLILYLLVLPALGYAQTKDKAFPEDTRNPYTHRFIFYAVLEGLYEDGVEDDVLAAIKGRQFFDNFIYGCPICTPVYQALQVYESRPELTGYKLERPKHFGKGLKKNERGQLLGQNPDERRKAIRALVSKYIEQRIKSHKLNNIQEKEMRAELKKMSDKGTKLLKTYLEDWEKKQKTIETIEKALKAAGVSEREITYAVQGLKQSALGRHYEGWEFCPSCSGATWHVGD